MGYLTERFPPRTLESQLGLPGSRCLTPSLTPPSTSALCPLHQLQAAVPSFLLAGCSDPASGPCPSPTCTPPHRPPTSGPRQGRLRHGCPGAPRVRLRLARTPLPPPTSLLPPLPAGGQDATLT